MSDSRPRILVLADEPGWAWERKAENYRRCLGGHFDITVGFHGTAARLDFNEFDLVHLFEVSQTRYLDPYQERRFRAVSGLTAHVWKTWGENLMRKWAAHVDALHANSLLLFHELRPFHPHVYYTPNGVDVNLFKRTSRHPDEITFAHVGKDNPRKGGKLIVEAGRRVGVRPKILQRPSKFAYSAQEMVVFYQGVHVMVTASNMDGTPNPMLEGAACKCALLSTPIGNMPEVIRCGCSACNRPSPNGFLTKNTLPVRPGPAKAPWPMTPEFAAEVERGEEQLIQELAERMDWFLRHPAETMEMGERARETVVADWTWEKQVEHVATMWREVLGA